MDQKQAFLQGEGDAWFQRNRAADPPMSHDLVLDRLRHLHLRLLLRAGSAYPQAQQQQGADGGSGCRDPDAGTAKTMRDQRTTGRGQGLVAGRPSVISMRAECQNHRGQKTAPGEES